MAMHIGKPVVTPLIAIGKAFMVDPHKVLNGRVKVVNVNWVLGYVIAPIIGLAVGDTTLHAAAR